MAAKTMDDVFEFPLEDAFIRCRTYGHAWDPWSPPADAGPVFGIREYLRCVRCGTERHAIFSPLTGERYEACPFRYVYPFGYKAAGSAPRAVWRAEAFRRDLHTQQALSARRNGKPLAARRNGKVKR